MSTITETAVAHVDVTESEVKPEDLNIDEVAKASKLAALKSGCDGVSDLKDETEQPFKSSNNSHTNGDESTNGDVEKFGQNGGEVPEHTNPNKDAATDHTDENVLGSAEAVQDTTEQQEEKDLSEDGEKSQDEPEANCTGSTEVAQEDPTEQMEVVAHSE